MLKQTAKLVAAYARNNLLRAEDLPELIVAIYNGLATVGTTHEAVEAPIPAVSVKKSVTPDYIVCLEDGKKLKTLKRLCCINENLAEFGHFRRLQASFRETGMPRPVMRLMTLPATLASTFCAGRVRARSVRPMMTL